jgi:hypothetical protein
MAGSKENHTRDWSPSIYYTLFLLQRHNTVERVNMAACEYKAQEKKESEHRPRIKREPRKTPLQSGSCLNPFSLLVLSTVRSPFGGDWLFLMKTRSRGTREERIGTATAWLKERQQRDSITINAVARIHSAFCIMAFVRSTFLWWLQYKHTLLSLQEAIHARDTKPAHKTKQQKPAHKTKQQKLEGLSLDPHCWIYDTFLIPACNCSP